MTSFRERIKYYFSNKPVKDLESLDHSLPGATLEDKEGSFLLPFHSVAPIHSQHESVGTPLLRSEGNLAYSQPSDTYDLGIGAMSSEDIIRLRESIE